MEISTKIIVNELTKGLLGSVSRKVCTDKKSEKYGQLVKDTLIRDFLAKSNPIPSERLCNRINDLFDYELYPHNYNKKSKHDVTPEEMAERIRRYIVGLLSCDLTETILNEPIDISTASKLIGDLLIIIEEEKEIPIEKMAHLMKMKYAKTSSFVSFVNLKDYHTDFIDHYYSYLDRINIVRDSIRRFWSYTIDEQRIDANARDEADQALLSIKGILNLYLDLLKAERYEDIPAESRKNLEKIGPSTNYLYSQIESDNNDLIVGLLLNGFNKSEAPAYINCLFEILERKDNLTCLSDKSQKLIKKAIAQHNKIFTPYGYNEYFWKIIASQVISDYYSRFDYEIQYLYYYIKEYIVLLERQPHRYELGINKMFEVYTSLNKEINYYYESIDPAVINEIENVISGNFVTNKPNAAILEKIKEYTPNQLLIGYGGGLKWFEEKICNIINILKVMQKTEEGIESGRIFF